MISERTFHFFCWNHAEWPEWSLAWCIEHDFLVQAQTRAELRHEAEAMLLAHVEACRSRDQRPFQASPPSKRVLEEYQRAGESDRMAVTVRVDA